METLITFMKVFITLFLGSCSVLSAIYLSGAFVEIIWDIESFKSLRNSVFLTHYLPRDLLAFVFHLSFIAIFIGAIVFLWSI